MPPRTVNTVLTTLRALVADANNVLQQHVAWEQCRRELHRANITGSDRAMVIDFVLDHAGDWPVYRGVSHLIWLRRILADRLQKVLTAYEGLESLAERLDDVMSEGQRGLPLTSGATTSVSLTSGPDGEVIRVGSAHERRRSAELRIDGGDLLATTIGRPPLRLSQDGAHRVARLLTRGRALSVPGNLDEARFLLLEGMWDPTALLAPDSRCHFGGPRPAVADILCWDARRTIVNDADFSLATRLSAIGESP